MQSSIGFSDARRAFEAELGTVAICTGGTRTWSGIDNDDEMLNFEITTPGGKTKLISQRVRGDVIATA